MRLLVALFWRHAIHERYACIIMGHNTAQRRAADGDIDIRASVGMAQVQGDIARYGHAAGIARHRVFSLALGRNMRFEPHRRKRRGDGAQIGNGV